MTIERDERDLQIATLQRRLAEAEAQVAAAEAARERAIVEGHLRDAIARSPDLHPAAAADVLRRGVESGEWRLDSRGRLMRLSDGQPEIDHTGAYVGPKSWLATLRQDAPHLFVQVADKVQAEQPAGAAATAGATNPWSPQHRNLTEQMRIYKANPDLARRLAAEHGVKI